jgi:8-oxo-dGTP pyrophosphatase MutT (NUDIX family)
MIPAEAIVYRPNVAAILQRENGDIFVAERINIKGAWQFPQGGIDEGRTRSRRCFVRSRRRSA